MTIGEKIKELRKKNDLTQEKLADYLCVSYQAVSKWETGISSPDLSLIVPLTRLLHVSADELFGLNETEPDKRRDEIQAVYDATWKTGDLQERHKIAEAAVKEYPGEMKYLDWLAWTTAMCSFDHVDDETYRAEQEKAIKIFATIIENCTDEKIKNHAIFGITQYLQFRGRKDEARKYADLYPEHKYPNKDEILLHCLSGDEKKKHLQQLLMDNLFGLISRLDWFETLQSQQLMETLIKLFITDENYLNTHALLYRCYRSQVQCLMPEARYDEAINIVEKVLYHAKEYDKLFEEEKIYRYTAPLFDMLEFDSANYWRSGTSTVAEEFYEWIEFKVFDPIRDEIKLRLNN